MSKWKRKVFILPRSEIKSIIPINIYNLYNLQRFPKLRISISPGKLYFVSGWPCLPCNLPDDLPSGKDLLLGNFESESEISKTFASRFKTDKTPEELGIEPG